MKPKVYIDITEECIRIESNSENSINITELHSFVKDIISVLYNYHKLFPEKKVDNYIDNSYIERARERSEKEEGA